MTLAISRASAFGRANTRSVERIDEIHVHRNVKSGGVERRNLNCFGYHVRQSTLIQFAHREYAYTKSTQQLSLARIYAASANDRGILGQNLWRKSCDVRQFPRPTSEQGRQGHPMNIAGRRCLRCFRVCMRVEPYYSDSLI